MKKIIFLLGACTSIMVSCNDAAKTETNTMVTNDSSTFDLSRARSDIEADNAKFIEQIRKGDSNALADHYHSEAQILMPNFEPIMRKDISATWGGFLRMGVKDFKMTTHDVVGNEDLLVETGSYEMIGDKNVTIDKGKYMVAWRKENGNWKLYRDMGSSNMPMPPAK